MLNVVGKVARYKNAKCGGRGVIEGR